MLYKNDLLFIVYNLLHDQWLVATIAVVLDVWPHGLAVEDVVLAEGVCVDPTPFSPMGDAMDKTK